jgi:transglutaminase-like putative cysteine protease
MIFILLVTLSPISSKVHSEKNDYPHTSNPGYGVSNYKITQSVKYQVETNFTLIHKSGISSYIFKFSRLNNRVPNSSLSRYCPPYQESKLLYNEIKGVKSADIIMGHQDKFRNVYDSFNATLLPLGAILTKTKQKITYNQKYVISLNAIEFQNIEESDIGIYDTSSSIFDLYCNNPEPYYERDNPSLITLSNSIVSASDNPIKKTEKIINWISENLDYNENMPPKEKGAFWAYNNLEGDCSEFSSLMVTLLRIQNIPARKVTGFLLSIDPSTKPIPGEIWNYHASDQDSNILGHAWVEYYVPNIGWIACDPTWNVNSDYFNRIDYLRFNLNVGANFFFPPYSTISEFSNPLFSYTLGAIFEFNYDIKITVIEFILEKTEDVYSSLNIPVIIGVIIVVISLFALFRKSRRKKRDYY